MSRARKFDWDKALARHANGESVATIAADFGVSRTAVFRAVNPEYRARDAERQRKAQQSGVCFLCGKQCSWNPTQQVVARCLECWYDSQRLFTDTEVWCWRCQRWLPHDQFAPQRLKLRKSCECRNCSAEIKRRWRVENREHSNAYDREYKKRRRLAAKNAVLSS